MTVGDISTSTLLARSKGWGSETPSLRASKDSTYGLAGTDVPVAIVL